MLVTHIKKDFNLIIKSPYIIVFMGFWILLSLLMAQSSSLNYMSNISDVNLSISQIHEYQKEASINYWKNLASIGGIFILIISSLFISDEEENGMAAYILSYGINPYLLSLSKIFIIALLSFLLSIFSFLIFVFVFWFTNSLFILPIQNFLGSLILFGVIFALSSIGMFIGKIFIKKGLCISVAIFYMIISAYTSSVGLHLAGDYLSKHYFGNELAHLSVIPPAYKTMFASNPVAMTEALIPLFNINVGKNVFSMSYVSIFGISLDIIILLGYIIIFNILHLFIIWWRYGSRRLIK